MGNMNIPVVKRSLLSWIIPGNMRLHALVAVLISVAVFTRVFPLEMQKRIINQAINLGKMDLLIRYCGLYLASVVLSHVIKYLINLTQNLISQRTLAHMRRDLYSHILSLPLSFFRKTGAGLVVSSLVQELAAAGDFVGMSIGVPLTSILTLLAFAAYLLWLNPLLAIVSLLTYPMIVIFIPLLQKRANMVNKRRLNTTRKLSNLITESITGIHEVHGNGSFKIENTKFDKLVTKLSKIRITWGLWRFGVKSTNNFFTSLGPFIVFILGGWLTIKGRLELGALVAFLSAQQRLYDPWSELMDFYQLYQDASVGYKKSMHYFDVQPQHNLQPEGRKPFQLEGALEVKDLSFITEESIQLLDGVSFSLKQGEHMALVGFSGSGKSTLAQCIGQLHKYTGGHVLIGGKEVSDLTKADVVNNVGIIAQSPFIFDGTLEENLLYSRAALLNGDGNGKQNNLIDQDDLIQVLQQTGVFADVLRFGLNAFPSPERHHDIVSAVIRMRKKFQREFGEKLVDFVEFFDKKKYLYHSSVSENLIFGSPTNDEFVEKNVLHNRFFVRFLEESGLMRPLLQLGADLSNRVIDILGNLPTENAFFQNSPIAADELDGYKALVDLLKNRTIQNLSSEDRQQILEVALRFRPARHKMVDLPNHLEESILAGRTLFKKRVLAYDPAAIIFFDKSSYILSQTILNNILFGRITTSKSDALSQINESIIQLLINEDLLETMVRMGMQFQVGTKGDRLSGGQRQKLAIARAFLKSPRILIMDEATSGLDNKSQARIQNHLNTRLKGHTTVISVVHRLDITKSYDKIAVMVAGKIAEMGTYEALMEQKGVFYDLIRGQK